jgi:hypothetical protein
VITEEHDSVSDLRQTPQVVPEVREGQRLESVSFVEGLDHVVRVDDGDPGVDEVVVADVADARSERAEDYGASTRADDAEYGVEVTVLHHRSLPFSRDRYNGIRVRPACRTGAAQVVPNARSGSPT